MNTTREALHALIDQRIQSNSIHTSFPKDMERLSESDLSDSAASIRKDFRSLNTFTIDSESSKDLDDAISVSKTADGYLVGVHIADVSNFIRQGSPLDAEALNRGSSIYLPDLTIPMLPKILTEDLCSLVEGQDRYTISVMIRLDRFCNVSAYSVSKGLIRSRVKGVYREVNRILSGEADQSTREKYACVTEDLHLLKHIAYALLRRRRMAGAVIRDNAVPKILVFENEIQIVPQPHGDAERIVEELMVLANRLVSEYLMEHNLPCLFRSQRDGQKMAEYGIEKNGHYSLALRSYCHFTSPIRRYSDVIIHRFLTASFCGDTATIENTLSMLEENNSRVCSVITSRIRRAKAVTNSVNRFCYSQFFMANDSNHSGRITGFNNDRRARIRMDGYNITILSGEQLCGRIGSHVMFKVSADAESRSYYATDCRISA